MPETTTRPNWEPNNPHPLAKMKTELVWEGKYDEYGNRRPVKLPSLALLVQVNLSHSRVSSILLL